MNHKTRILLGLLVLAIAAGGAAPWRSLPSCVIGKWSGITATDPNGNIIGPEDPNDWGCLGSGGSYRPNDGVPTPPPNTCLRPATPNPTSGRTILNFSLKEPSQVSLVVYAKRNNGPHSAYPVRALVSSQQLQAGAYSYAWDGTDDNGVPLTPGIYRVVMFVSDQCLSGDIEIQ